MKIESLVRENILKLKAYSSARSLYTKGLLLDANENAFINPNDKIGLNRYPDGSNNALREVLSAKFDLKSANCAIGNGSDELLDILIRIFCEPGKDSILITSPTYGMYEVLANINNVNIIDVSLLADFSLDMTSLLKRVEETKIVFLCRPNNPTGNVFPKQDILKILKCNCIVVVDEAYAEFMSDESMISELDKYPNLVVLRTLSKAYALAGARLGYLFAGTTIIDLIQKTKLPYNINVLTTKVVSELIKFEASERINIIKDQREKVKTELASINGIKVFESQGNYLLFQLNNADKIFDELVKKGIIIRSRTSQIPDSLRVTIGTEEQNNLFIKTLKEIL